MSKKTVDCPLCGGSESVSYDRAMQFALQFSALSLETNDRLEKENKTMRAMLVNLLGEEAVQKEMHEPVGILEALKK